MDRDHPDKRLIKHSVSWPRADFDELICHTLKACPKLFALFVSIIDDVQLTLPHLLINDVFNCCCMYVCVYVDQRSLGERCASRRAVHISDRFLFGSENEVH